MILEGRARVFGDDVNTDYIISSKRKRETIDESKLRAYVFESVDPAFAASVRPGDIIVGGTNFGCGSAMEIAVTVLQAAGIQAVIAKSFARSFYRNAINNGLVVVACETSAILEDDHVAITLGDSSATVRVPARGIEVTGAPLPPLVRQILQSGGLVAFLREGGDL
jgi:3-isopropylmalate/(R)-2-methylmalate dehydratase small subunit